MVLVGSLIFAVQMVDFPIGGRVIGTTSSAVFWRRSYWGRGRRSSLCPRVLVLQTIRLGDGGIATLGANAFNMVGIVGVLGGYAYLVFLQKDDADGTANQRRLLINASMAA